MLSANPSCSKLSIVTLALGMIAVFGLPLRAQEAPAVHVGNTLITGLPDDWSHHHQVFSNPGTEQDAIKNGTHDRWLKTVNDPRYVIHQLKRGLPVQGPAAQDVEMWRRIAAQDAAMRDSWDGRKHKNPTPNPNNPSLDKDWSMSLGSGGFLKAGQYPAKYNFGISTAPCSDFVVYPTGLAGGAAQATVVAYNNIYNNSTCTGLGAVPLINWAYNTGGTANLSPIISSNGTQVAYIQTASSVASLVLLKPGPNTTGRTVTGTLAASSPEVTLSSGTFTAADVGVQITGTGITAGDTIATVLSTTTANLAAAPSAHAAETLTIVAETAAAPGVPTLAGSPSAYRSCTAPCYFTITLHNSPNDTNSAPYVVYDGDFIYVGDDSGNLHKFTGVFSGNPAEVVSGTAPIWPVSVTSTAGKLILTSPVFDPVSGNIFVADEGGFLYSYSASAATRVMKSSQLTYASGTVGIVDSPLVDSSTGKVYVFVGDDANTASNVGCDNGTGCTGVFQFSATLTGTGTGGSGGCDATSTSSWNGATSCGVEAVFGVGTTTTPTTYDGAFDQIYYNGSGASGNLWVCAPHAGSTPRLAFVTMQSGGSIVSSGVLVVGNTAILALASAQATCSPVTEVYGSNGGTNDYIFLSVSGSSSLSATGCGTGNACAYNFLVGNGVTESTPSNATAGIIEAGGTSGIIIDNNLATASGESQIYFTSLANATCAGNGTTGSGSGGCAVQASQTAP